MNLKSKVNVESQGVANHQTQRNLSLKQTTKLHLGLDFGVRTCTGVMAGSYCCREADADNESTAATWGGARRGGRGRGR
jgi:hypothetical protein